jgi:alpha-1,3-fucosyltransferase
MKRILFWNKYFQSRYYEFGLGHEPFIKAGCQYSNCMTTDNRKLINISDAVLFHAIDFNEIDIPDIVFRRSNQRYIFYNYETCVGQGNMPVFVRTNDFFNWTMTYRRDSDIYDPLPYGSIRSRIDSFHPSLVVMPSPLNLEMTSAFQAPLIQNKSISLLKNKKKMVAWFVSHCHTNGLREIYFRKLSKYVEIDVYGDCGKLKCLPSRSLKCDQLLDSYKFYVAAENAICTDYVSEKFYRAMAFDIVPIVYGGADYPSYAPSISYIDVSDFKSPKDLARYLNLLNENDALYLQYFYWKSDYEVISRPVAGWCELCEKLNNPDQRPKVYQNISNWWFQNGRACVPGYDFLKGFLGGDILTR